MAKKKKKAKDDADVIPLDKRRQKKLEHLRKTILKKILEHADKLDW